MKLADLIRIGKETISTLYPEREAGEMVFAYLEEAIGTKRHTHIVDPEYDVPAANADPALEAFRRMAGGEPLQYVLGKAWFYGRQFHVTSDVLIPRPETEVLCDRILKYVSEKRGIQASMPYPSKILDMCTGSGCIAWTLALEMPGSKVTAVDISEGALRVASTQDFSEEASRAKALSPRFIKADVLETPESIPELFEAVLSEDLKYDIIASNPPYVMAKEKSLMRSNVLDHEPHLALFVSDDDPLVFYRAVAAWARKLLKKDGYGIVEINEALGEETADVFRQAGFQSVNVIKDLSDRDRFVEFTRIN
jgi:release factor glutamine methyltransferase